MNLDELRRRRTAATEAWQVQFDDPDLGWSVADVDVAPVLAPFGVACDPAFAIVVISEQWGRDGEGHTYAVTAAVAADVTRRLARELDAWEDEYPPAVPEALDDLGAALVKVERSADLLTVSVAVQELHEMGARGHGARWLDEQIVGGAHLAEPPPEGDWEWRGPRPDRFEPTEIDTRHGPLVVFHTRTEIGGHRLLRYEDHYRRDSLAATRRIDVLARAPGGAVH